MAWWVILLVILVILTLLAVLLTPRLRCRLDPPCALPAASAAPGSIAFAAASPSDAPEVAWVEIVPAVVSVEPGANGVQLTLDAVLRDKDGFVIPPAAGIPVTWTVGSGLSAVSTGLQSITLAVGGNVSQASDVSVSAAAGPPGSASSTPARIRVTLPASPDKVNADHAPGAPATALLADVELKDDTKLGQTPFAFVREQAFGQIKQKGPDWGSILVLSPVQEPVVRKVPGLGSMSSADAQAAASPATSLKVDVAIWVAIPAFDVAAGILPADVAARAQTDVLWTNAAYGRARTGMGFAFWSGQPVLLDGSTPEGADAVDLVNAACQSQQFANLPVRQPGVMNVYYVGSDGPEGIAREVDDEPVVCIGTASQRSQSVLAHELGHGFGLADAYVTPETPFTAVNIMGYLESGHVAPRDRFSLGQVFRIVLSETSWLVKGALVTWSGEDCFAINCPALTLDLESTPKP